MYNQYNNLKSMECNYFLESLEKLLHSARKEDTIDAKNNLIENSIHVLMMMKKVDDYRLVYKENEYSEIRTGKRFNILQHKTTKQYWLQSTIRTNTIIQPTCDYKEAESNWRKLESDLEVI